MNSTVSPNKNSSEDFLSRLVNPLLKRSHRRLDVWNNHQPRVLVVATLALIIAIFAFNIGYGVTGNSFETLHIISFVLSIIALTAIYAFYRFGNNFSLVVDLSMIVNSVILLGFITVTGGYESPVIAAILFLPFLAFLFKTRKEAFGWTLISMVCYFALYLSSLNHVVFPQILDQAYLKTAQLFGWIMLCTGLVMGLYIHGKVNETAALYITRKSQEYAKAADLDARTGLLNTKAFQVLAKRLLSEKDPETSRCFMLMKILNLDEIRALLNREQIAAFWKTLGNVSLQVSRGQCEIAHVSEDEIMFVQENAPSAASVYNIGRSLCALLKRVAGLDDLKQNVNIRCGVVMHEAGTMTMEELLRKCEAAIGSTSAAEVCRIARVT